MTEPTEGTGAMAERAVALLAENGYALLEAQDIVRWLREDGLLAALPRPTAPRREDVEKAIDAFRLACVARGALGRTDGIEAEMDATGAALLALYDAALTGAPEEVSEDDLCEDCLTQKATEFFETVPNQRCKDCTIKMLDEMCERLQAEKPTPVDDPQAKGRIAAILRDRDLRPITVTPLEAAERILKEICGPAARGAEGQAVAWGVTQTITGDDGNCLEAAIATVTGIPLDEFPLDLLGHPETHPKWFSRLRDWLYFHDWTMDEVHGEPPSGLHVAVGPSPRKAGSHAVVVLNGKYLFDPHPSRTFFGVGEAKYYITLDRRVQHPLPPVTTPTNEPLNSQALEAAMKTLTTGLDRGTVWFNLLPECIRAYLSAHPATRDAQVDSAQSRKESAARAVEEANAVRARTDGAPSVGRVVLSTRDAERQGDAAPVPEVPQADVTMLWIDLDKIGDVTRETRAQLEVRYARILHALEYLKAQDATPASKGDDNG